MRKKTLHKITVLLSFVFAMALLFTACGASEPPIGHIVFTNVKDYGRYNQYVRSVISKQGVAFLPSDAEQLSVAEYKYEYQCSVFGDPNFAIRLKVKYEPDKFRKECVRLTENALSTAESGKSTIWFHRGELSNTKELFDDKLLSGKSFFFEAALSDSDELTIDYLVAQQYDAATHIADTETYMKNVIGLFDNTTGGGI